MLAAGRRQLVADLSLLAVACVWGSTFPLAAAVLRHLPPFSYLAIRFALATAVLLVVLAFRRDARGLRAGLAPGVALGVGYAAQTLGLPLAGATVSAFLTGLSILLVPPVGLFFGRRTSARDALAVLAGTAGLAMLTLRGDGALRTGEALLLVCAIAFAFQIVLTDRAAQRASPLALAVSQNAAVALLTAGFAVVEPRPPAPPLWVWGAVLGLGLFASAAAFLVQSWAQRFTSPAHVGLLFAAEPLSAALFARLFLDERLGAVQWLGAALLVAAMIFAGTGTQKAVPTDAAPPSETPARGEARRD